MNEAYDDSKLISGTYLTRDSLFKAKAIPWLGWWTALDPIVLEPLIFNVGDGCAFWKHSLVKNLRKSFPWKVNSITFYGDVKAQDKTMQNVASIAFGELYARPKLYPSISEGLERATSVACAKKYILDRKIKRLLFNGRLIGGLDGNKILLHKKCAFFHRLLTNNHGVAGSQIEIIEEPIVILNHSKPIPQKDNLHYIDLYDVEFSRPYSGYCVFFKQAEEEPPLFRTYIGPYPGADKIMPGWKIYNNWSEENWG